MNENKMAMNVDVSKSETIKCEKCGNALFLPSFILKKISALVSPTGKEAIFPVQVFSCGSCGHINKEIVGGMLDNMEE